jgi:putative two-component system response regulator
MSESAVLDDLSDETLRARQRGSEWSPLPYEQPKVLVVDDDDDTRETVAMLLQRAGVTVLQAGTADAALRLSKSEQVSAVILDVMLPDSNGFEVCRLLRDDQDTRRIRVIMLTSLSGITDEVTGILAGADAYLVKPVRRAELLRRLGELI